MRMAAIYARVSSEQQREENTIASQTASLIEFAKSHDLEVPIRANELLDEGSRARSPLVGSVEVLDRPTL